MTTEFLHLYRKFREYGYTAEGAYKSAKAQIYFRKRLKKLVSKRKKRKCA